LMVGEVSYMSIILSDDLGQNFEPGKRLGINVEGSGDAHPQHFEAPGPGLEWTRPGQDDADRDRCRGQGRLKGK
jgi:hypothetical protein